MKIITISGKAGNGKDYTANLIKEQLESHGNKVLITHYADLLKYICKTFFNWNGNKDIEGRTLLQTVGSDIRNFDQNYWVNFLKGIFTLFSGEWDFILIPDTRYINEIELIKDEFDLVTLRIERPNFDNGLTEEQKNHKSETELDNYLFNYTIINNGDESIYNEISKFMIYLSEGSDLNES